MKTKARKFISGILQTLTIIWSSTAIVMITAQWFFPDSLIGGNKILEDNYLKYGFELSKYNALSYQRIITEFFSLTNLIASLYLAYLLFRIFKFFGNKRFISRECSELLANTKGAFLLMAASGVIRACFFNFFFMPGISFYVRYFIPVLALSGVLFFFGLLVLLHRSVQRQVKERAERALII